MENRNEENGGENELVLSVKQLSEMRSTGNIKIIILVLFVGLVRFLFVFVTILTVSVASNLSSYKIKPMLDENPVIAKIIVIQPISNIDYRKIKLILDKKPVFPKVIVFRPTLNIDYHKIRLVLGEKPVFPKVMRPQPIKDDYTTAKIDHGLTLVAGNETERLFHPIIIKTAIRYQIDPALVKAIIMAESGYNSRAISKNGAIGLMQLMPGTAQELNIEDIFNPKQNIDGGVRYFKQLVNQFSGDLKLALAAYNAGSRTVRQYKGVPPFKETQHYIEKVFEYYQLYKNRTKEEVDSA